MFRLVFVLLFLSLGVCASAFEAPPLVDQEGIPETTSGLKPPSDWKEWGAEMQRDTRTTFAAENYCAAALQHAGEVLKSVLESAEAAGNDAKAATAREQEGLLLLSGTSGFLGKLHSTSLETESEGEWEIMDATIVAASGVMKTIGSASGDARYVRENAEAAQRNLQAVCANVRGWAGRFASPNSAPSGEAARDAAQKAAEGRAEAERLVAELADAREAAKRAAENAAKAFARLEPALAEARRVADGLRVMAERVGAERAKAEEAAGVSSQAEAASSDAASHQVQSSTAASSAAASHQVSSSAVASGDSASHQVASSAAASSEAASNQVTSSEVADAKIREAMERKERKDKDTRESSRGGENREYSSEPSRHISEKVDASSGRALSFCAALLFALLSVAEMAR